MISSSFSSRNALAIFVLIGLALCFAYPTFLISNSSPKSAYYLLVILPGLILLGLDFKVFGENVKDNPAMQLVVVMMAYWCLTLLWGSNDVADSQLRRAIAVLIYVCVVWHVLSHYSQFIKHFYTLMFLLFFVGFLWSLSSILASNVLLAGYRLGTGTPFGQAIHAGHYYGTFFCLTLGWALFGRERFLVVLSSSVCVLALVAIILTKSRGVYLATAVAVAFAAGLYVWSNKKFLLATCICFVLTALALTIYYYFPGFFLNRGSSHRFEIWGESWRMIQNNFWFGLGLGERPGITASKFSHAHNLYLNIWLTTGVVGLLLFLSAVAAVLNGAFRQPLYKEAGCLIAMAFFGVAMMTDLQQLINSPNEAWLCFWFIFACLATRGSPVNALKHG
ncbi:O-antigen ligase family protein [Dasania marina]|uniref:O-antigen ligase family protein n=1 Tax=Dasania marina TaxID=471499 RepID=UPI0003660DE1|nr:O-antigen ligase family protein [Dasania marina]